MEAEANVAYIANAPEMENCGRPQHSLLLLSKSNISTMTCLKQYGREQRQVIYLVRSFLSFFTAPSTPAINIPKDMKTIYACAELTGFLTVVYGMVWVGSLLF